MATETSSPHDPTRAKLLEAAAEVFAEHGFHAATVREICSRAGANVASVNYYFGDKVELYQQVLRESMQKVHSGLVTETSAGMKAPEALELAIHNMLRRVCKARRSNLTMRLMMHELTNPTPGLALVVNEVIGPNYRMLRGIIGQLIGHDPDDDETRLCAHSVIGQVIHYAQARPVIGYLWPSLELNDATLERIAQHIGEFSLAYLKTYRRTHSKLPSKQEERS